MVHNNLSDQALVTAEEKSKEKSFWLEKLGGQWEKTTFPHDLKDDEKRYKKEVFSFTVPPETAARLLQLSTGADEKLHIILTAVLALLLHKYNHTPEYGLLLGTPIYKQDTGISHTELTNTLLPLKIGRPENISFKELLLQVRGTVVEAAQNQAYPMQVLAAELGRTYSPEDFPFFDTALLLENIHDPAYLQHVFPDTLFVFNRKETEIEAAIEYNGFRYRPASIEQITRHFQTLLDKAVHAPDTGVHDLDILSEAEKEDLFTRFNRTGEAAAPQPVIHYLFEEQVKKTPEAPAVTGPPDADGDGVTLTYSQLNAKANQLAHLLRDRGVKGGGIIGVLTDRTPEMAVSLLAVLKAGCAYLAIDPTYPEKRIVTILADAGASFLLTQTHIAGDMTFTRLQNIKSGRVTPFLTPKRPPIEDFNGLPRPDRKLINFKEYQKYPGLAPVKYTVAIQGSRGCPYNCIYCHKLWPKRLIKRDADNIYEEMEYYYKMGVRRFVFIDDIFNLDKKNSGRLLRRIIKNKMKLQLFFSNGLRGDILTKDFIDLMIEAGTVDIDVALESASPRIQKILQKNLDLDKFHENTCYIADTYDHVLLEMEMMHGFPSETKEEALMTLDFMKSIRWLDFPNLNILKVFPNTDIYRFAIQNGVTNEAVENSARFAYHELPETLPWPKEWTLQFQARYMNEYFLLKERLLEVLPRQMKVLTEEELILKYDNYLPLEIRSVDDLLQGLDVTREELGGARPLDNADFVCHEALNLLTPAPFPPPPKEAEAKERRPLRILLLDLSQFFTDDTGNMLFDVVEEPLGLMYLMTYLNEKMGDRIVGKIAKSRLDFNDYHQLKQLVTEFQPDIIGLRTLSFFREFFHHTLSMLKQWNAGTPIISGGPYASSDYLTMLQDPNIDLVAIGEGEITFTRLVEEMIAHGNKMPPESVLETIESLAFIREQDKPLVNRDFREVILLDQVEEELPSYSAENPPHRSEPGDLLYLVSTSGSTGKPKSVMLEHRNLANLLHDEFTGGGVQFNRVLQFTSIGFDVSAQEIFSTLCSGGQLFLLSDEMKNDFGQLFQYIDDNGMEVLFLPPALLRFIFNDPHYRDRFPGGVKHIIAAGERLEVGEHFRGFLERNRTVLHNHYGPAETHVVTTHSMETGAEVEQYPSIGSPVTNTALYILDGGYRLKPLGAVGEIAIAGANVGRGYLNHPELTNEKFISLEPEPSRGSRGSLPLALGEPSESPRRAAGGTLYLTGDLGRWLEDGTLEFVGRKDSQVKIRGFRIEPGEVEHALRGLEAIKDAVVDIGVDVKGDNFLCAYVVKVPGSGKLDLTRTRHILEDRLPDYMVPGHFVELEEIPLSPNGKVDRKALPVPDPGARAQEYAEPRNPLERKLAALWAEVLDRRYLDVGIDDNFFLLGGHSLNAAILTTRLHKEFGVKLPLGEVFKHPSVRKLACVIKDQATAAFSAIEPAEPAEHYQLSPSQKRLYVAWQMEKESCAYNMPALLRLRGALDFDRLHRAFRALVRRHEGLRTSLLNIGRELVQVVHPVEDTAVEIEGPFDGAERSEQEEIITGFIRPFDLGKAPLFRVGLIRVSGEEYILMVDMHHVITDGFSLAILANDFMALYEGRELPPIRLHYKDYAQWRNRLEVSGKLDGQEAYWLERFSREGLAELELPVDYPRPAVRRIDEGDYVPFSVEGKLRQQVLEAAESTGATLFMVLLAAYNLLLSIYTNREDIIVGTLLAGRSHADLEQVIGMFVNTLPLRNFPGRDKSFEVFLGEVKENLLGAYDNQDYSFDQLVNRLELQGDSSRNPLFDTIFTLAPFSDKIMAALKDSELRCEPYDMEGKFAKFDLHFLITEEGEAINILLRYSTQLFKRVTIEGIIRDYLDILEQVTRDTAVCLGDVSVSHGLKEVTSSIHQEDDDNFNF